MAAVIKTRAHAALETLRERLAALPSVPAPAAAFHARRQELAAEIEGLLGAWLPRAGDERLAALEGSVAVLEALAKPLAEHVARAQELAEEVAELRARASASHGEEVCRWVETRCAEQRLEFATHGARALDVADLAPERRRLGELEGELRADFQRVFWLGRLDQALAGFGDNVPDDALETVQRVYSETLGSGGGARSLETLRAQVAALEQRAALEARRPRELRTVARLLPRLRGWAEALDTRAAEVRALDKRYQEVAIDDWQGALPAELERAAERLETELIGRAAEVRGLRCAGLRRWLAELASVSGEPPEMGEQLAALERRELRQPQSYRGWLKDWERARERLGALAANHRGALGERLAARLAEIHAALGAELAAEAEPIAAAAQGLAEAADAEALLDGLCRARELLVSAEGFRRRAAEARAALDVLEARRLEVLAELAELERASPDPAERATAARLAAQITETTGEHARVVAENRHAVSALIERAEQLRARREAVRRTLAERAERLRRRLDDWRERGGAELCPRWGERLTALVYGLPAPASEHQLAAAEYLCDRLEHHTARCTARCAARDPAPAAPLAPVLLAPPIPALPGRAAETGVQLTLWGPSAAGKTVLLAQLYAEAEQGGEWAIFPTVGSLDFVRQMRARMAAANAFPPATSVGAVEQIAYRFHHRRTGVETELVLEDRAGKDYEELEDDTRERLASAAGLVLLFDPRRSPAAFEREVWDTLESVHVACGRGARRDERPIAVCLSKADALLRTPADLERACAEPDAFVRERVGASVLRALERFCARYRLFPISATGVRRRGDTLEPVVFYDEALRHRVCPEGAVAFNVMAPFAWLLGEVLGLAEGEK